MCNYLGLIRTIPIGAGGGGSRAGDRGPFAGTECPNRGCGPFPSQYARTHQKSRMSTPFQRNVPPCQSFLLGCSPVALDDGEGHIQVVAGDIVTWKSADETRYSPAMPTRVRVPQRVVAHIGIAVEGLRVAGPGDKGVGLDETAQGGVVIAGFVVVKAQGVIPALAGVLAVGGEDAVPPAQLSDCQGAHRRAGYTSIFTSTHSNAGLSRPAKPSAPLPPLGPSLLLTTHRLHTKVRFHFLRQRFVAFDPARHHRSQHIQYPTIIQFFMQPTRCLQKVLLAVLFHVLLPKEVGPVNVGDFQCLHILLPYAVAAKVDAAKHGMQDGV
ncbi:hypothetical protein ARMA_1158 [Ardenticatena maritima]|uniref:Uncharacterized protein n=1 Tax=Ardenticatena maritima TaxID=872965 RepID=A0A0M8K6F5_9CHLR|nr:hypothetical protein ARMA_1158 [Ardenticatena maritima]